MTEMADDTIKRKPVNGRKEIIESWDVPQVSTINVGDGRSITVQKTYSSDTNEQDIKKVQIQSIYILFSECQIHIQ